MGTSTKVSFGLYVLEIKQDADMSTTTTLQDFSDLDALETDNVSLYPFVTYEPDYWSLSGSFRFLPDTDAKVGFVTEEMSDENGEFTTNPEITVDFSQTHSTDGLGFRFGLNSGDYPSEMIIRFYDGATLNETLTVYPDAGEWGVTQSFEDFDKIEIEIVSTNRPYRYARVTGIDFGQLISFEGDEIKNATVVEETNMLSAELRVNSFDLTLFSEDSDFSILSPTSHYTALEERQPVSVYVYTDSDVVFIGQYYLDTWENKSEKEVQFSCVDLLGLLENIPFRGGLYSSYSLPDLIDEILGDNDIPFQLDASFESTTVTGWLPYSNARDALQQVAFAIGAYVDSSRDWGVRIEPFKYAIDTAVVTAITKSDKGSKQKVVMKPLVTGVKVFSHEYVAVTESQELFNDTLTVGVHEVSFDEPKHTLSVTGATITESGANYAILTVASEGTVTLSGNPYQDITRPQDKNMVGLSASTKKNVVEVEKATLVNPGNRNAVLERVYGYYQQRYIQKMRLYAHPAKVGDTLTVETLYDMSLRGIIEKAKVNLSGGFVSDVEMIGVIDE
jgi:hypothetical protein